MFHPAGAPVADEAWSLEDEQMDQQAPKPPVPRVALDEQQRTAALSESVRALTEAGWRAEASTPLRAVLVRRRRPNRLLHAMAAVLRVFTLGGFSMPPAAPVQQRLVVTVDKWGGVHQGGARPPLDQGDQYRERGTDAH